MPDKQLITFIKEARKKGFSDLQIRKPLMGKGWPVEKIEEAFTSLNPKFKLKNQVCIFLDDEILKALEKRGKKNMLSVSEQIEDILRRSCVNVKTGYPQKIKVDDALIEIFSRERKGRKRKKLFR